MFLQQAGIPDTLQNCHRNIYRESSVFKKAVASTITRPLSTDFGHFLARHHFCPCARPCLQHFRVGPGGRRRGEESWSQELIFGARGGRPPPFFDPERPRQQQMCGPSVHMFQFVSAGTQHVRTGGCRHGHGRLQQWSSEEKRVARPRPFKLPVLMLPCRDLRLAAAPIGSWRRGVARMLRLSQVAALQP